jgi:SNF2 family DNA or RNA helicase
MLARPVHAQILQTVPWKLIVVDELHVMKNPNGLLSKHLRKLKDAVSCPVLGLTGTVMQNNHEELWNVVDLAVENFLGSAKEFEANFGCPIRIAR